MRCLLVLLSGLVITASAAAQAPPPIDGVTWSVSNGPDNLRYYQPDRSFEVADWQAAVKLLPRGDKDSSIWSIFDHPRDHPESLVIRETVAGAEGVVTSPAALYAATIVAARAKLPPGAAQIPKSPDDPKNLLEVWVAP